MNTGNMNTGNMNFDEVRRNPVYYEDRFHVDRDMNQLNQGEGMRMPPQDYNQQVLSTDSYPPHRAMVVDGQPRHTPVNVIMDASTINCYDNLDKTHLSHSNLKDKISSEITDMKRQSDGHLMAVQTDNQQSFCSEPILARLNYDFVSFSIVDVKDGGPKMKEPLEYGQVCLTEKRLFFVSRRQAHYTLNIRPEPSKTLKKEKTPTKATTKPQEVIQTLPKQDKPKAYRLQMDQDTGSSYYEMIPVWNVKSVAMNTSGKSTSSSVIYSKLSCCGRLCGCCGCLHDCLKVLLCDTCSCAPGKTWHSTRKEENSYFGNHDGNIDYLQIKRKVLIHATLPAWEQRAIVEIVVDSPTSIDRIADFIRFLQYHSQQLNKPTPFGGNHGHPILTISDNRAISLHGCS